MRFTLLALASGMPALVYQVIFTREVGLVLGSQVEATSTVLASFFGGLALGSWLLGPWADRIRSPLGLYAALEATAGVLAVFALEVLRALPVELGPVLRIVAPCLVAPSAIALGGTLPALLRAAEREAGRAPRTAGWLVGANTGGAVAGVVVAALAMPELGLRATLRAAAAMSLAVGGIAWLLARDGAQRPPQPAPRAARGRTGALVAAFAAGAATLGYEVAVGRMAALQLGSNLIAWALVLALFLLGLALGNLAGASFAARARRPLAALAWIECGAALAVVAGTALFSPESLAPSRGLVPATLLGLGMGALLPAFAMGAAFPFFVRLAAPDDPALGRRLGSVSAANTAGGIVGSLLMPFVLLPSLGLAGAALTCGAVGATLAVVLLAVDARQAASRPRSRLAAAVALVPLAGPPLLWLVLTPWHTVPATAEAGTGRLLFEAHGRQATAAVVHVAGRRDLVVDGDPEASTGGAPRRTEELLALVPLLFRPDATHFLEVGLGSGITLATAARFGLERIDCVEIAGSVLAARPYFAPANDAVVGGDDPRLRISLEDGRAYLLRHPATYDIVVANTVQPWSVGATGLYSANYFARLRSSLRLEGVAVQWLPVEGLGGEALAAILQSFFAEFPEGAVYWGADNLIVVGSESPLGHIDASRFARQPEAARRLLRDQGIIDSTDFEARRVSDAAGVRRALAGVEILVDDRPRLESMRLGRDRAARGQSEIGVVLRLAEAGRAGRDLVRWLESRRSRLAARDAEADRLESEAIGSGFRPARRARAARRAEEGRLELAAGRGERARAAFRRALRDDPDQAAARFGLAVLAFEAGDLTESARELRALLALWPGHAEAWNLLGVVEWRTGDRAAAGAAFGRAIEQDPFYAEALANAGLLAVSTGESARAQELLRRLRAPPGGGGAEAAGLAEALAARGL